MAEYLIQSETLDDIVDAINVKTGGSSAMTPAQMVTAIGSISGGGGITPTGTKNITITQNGTTTEDVTTYANAQITVNVPSGTTLPGVISKIDGGNFTLSTDTDCRTYDILHQLGVVPSAFVVWTDDITIGESQSINYLIRIHYYDTPYNTTTVSSHLESRISTSGSSVAGGGGVASANISDWVTASKICAYYNTNYKAGCVYKWLAWA